MKAVIVEIKKQDAAALTDDEKARMEAILMHWL